MAAELSRVLLVGWDAADWQVIHPLLDAGRLPCLRRLIEGGAMGNLASLSPMLSPMLWTSIATGKRAYDHGITGFVEPTPDRSGIRPVGSRSRRARALWNIVSQAGGRSVACGWLASHPAEPVRGAIVSNLFAVPGPGDTPEHWPLAAGAVHPPQLGETLADLRVHPREIEGAMLRRFVPEAAALDWEDGAVRQRLGVLATRLAEAIGVHAIATELLERQAWDFGAVYYECIDQLGHEFMPFHPPRLPETSAREFDAFRHVVEEAYCLHDEMLGQLVALAGPEAHVLVVSDHGFESGARRPRGPVEPAAWHRAQGICVLHGPRIAADATVDGASLLDVAPTVLALLGLPAGADMEGRALAGAFAAGQRELPGRIASWEDAPGDFGPLAPDPGPAEPAAAAEVLRQLIDLGYVAAPRAAAPGAVEQAEAEASFNLAGALLEGSRAAEARPLLAALTARFPGEARYWRAFAQACLAARSLDEALPAVAALERLEPLRPHAAVLRGLLAWAHDDLTAGLAAFRQAERLAPDDPVTQTYLGRVYLRQRRWPDAQRAFQRALAADPDLAEAHYGLSVALPRQGAARVEAGAEHALRAVGLRFDFPEAHFQLGAVLSRLGWFERAAQAFEITLRLRPGFVLAHRYLARIYSRLGRLDSARAHRVEAARLIAAKTAQAPVD